MGRGWQPAALCALFVIAAVAVDAGSLRGQLDVEEKPGRRVAQRYAGAAGPSSQEIAPIPSLVFIKGKVAGVSIDSLAREHSIAQQDTLFKPSFLVVPVGSAIGFPNLDDELHNVFSYSKARRFDLGRYPQGESKTVTFDRPGIVKIYCEIHPWMRAAVVVVENPFFTQVSKSGEFSIDGIPAGEYTVVMWSMDGGSEEVEVRVPPTGAVEVKVALSGREGSTVKQTTIKLPPTRVAEAPGGSDVQACCSGDGVTDAAP
jgi:plastocyanin